MATPVFTEQQIEDGEVLLRIKRNQIKQVARMGYDTTEEETWLRDSVNSSGRPDERLTIIDFLT